jgi:hypothetical protein
MAGAFVTPRLYNKSLWLVCLPLGLLWIQLYTGLGREYRNKSVGAPQE